jgi:hypothetical protein
VAHAGVFSEQAASTDPQPCSVSTFPSAAACLIAFPEPRYILFSADRDPDTGHELHILAGMEKLGAASGLKSFHMLSVCQAGSWTNSGELQGGVCLQVCPGVQTVLGASRQRVLAWQKLGEPSLKLRCVYVDPYSEGLKCCWCDASCLFSMRCVLTSHVGSSSSASLGVCAFSSPDCIAAPLHRWGHGLFGRIQATR